MTNCKCGAVKISDTGCTNTKFASLISNSNLFRSPYSYIVKLPCTYLCTYVRTEYFLSVRFLKKCTFFEFTLYVQGSASMTKKMANLL